MKFDIDIAIVFGFLFINLIIGLFYGRGVKNIKDYALGGRNFSTATLTATIIATWIGGDNFALYLSETYTHGLYFIFSVPGWPGPKMIPDPWLAPPCLSLRANSLKHLQGQQDL